jgi:hypothetical protein
MPVPEILVCTVSFFPSFLFIGCFGTALLLYWFSICVGGGATFIMEDGIIMGNSAIGGSGIGEGGGVEAHGGSIFTMKGGRIQGNTDSDGLIKNSATDRDAALHVGEENSAQWWTGGTYTKGGIEQTGGSNIGSTDETLIAIPAL